MGTNQSAGARLPIEVKCMIAEALNCPSDLANLSYVSHTWYDAAIRKLYRCLRFDIGSQNDVQLMAMTLNSRNNGLRYVKEVDLDLAVGGFQSQADATISVLLKLLPEDSLSRFHWRSWARLSQDTLRVLLCRQKKMSSVQTFHAAGLLDRLPPTPTLVANGSGVGPRELDGGDLIYGSGYMVPIRPTQTTGSLNHCVKLELFIQSRESFELSRILLSECKPVELSIRICRNVKNLSFMSVSGSPSTTAVQQGNHSGNFIRKLCQNRPWVTGLSSLNKLRSLTLFNIDLTQHSDWVSLVPFRALHTLRLRACSGLRSFLPMFRSYWTSSLTELEIQISGHDRDRTLTAIERYLRSTRGLVNLVLSMAGMSRMVEERCIRSHRSSLRLLNVHVAPNDDNYELHWTHQDLGMITRACVELEQLSCALPSTSIIDDPSDDWMRCIVAIKALPKLHTLRISTWPEAPESVEAVESSIYCCAIKSLAKQILNVGSDPTNHYRIPNSSSLRLVAFGITNQDPLAAVEAHQIYKRGAVSGVQGYVQAELVSSSERVHEMPESDILDKWVAFRKGPPQDIQ
ncbi:hypothetical protein BDZ85DRAFT_254721 [Elsinoe ampelina]|uniref:F-box domain-containing protein n=1 Tax=Elsinoe ampelina TaxID=302913 RepID=A0A6A6GPV9_9PEZI|nr:hypothetical protein BDZ85DRAFT_254721 [Elsinoe ampelina]